MSLMPTISNSPEIHWTKGMLLPDVVDLCIAKALCCTRHASLDAHFTLTSVIVWNK